MDGHLGFDSRYKHKTPHIRPLILMAFIGLCTGGCAFYGGVYTFFFQRDAEGKSSIGGDQRSIALAPALIVHDCSAACLQRADDGVSCAKYSEEAGTSCANFIGDKEQ
jgi:hypothetical protein